MDAASRVLLALDDLEVWAPRGRMRVSPDGEIQVERIVVPGGAAGFGTIGGAQTVAELQDAMTLWAGRMANLATAYGTLSPAWVARDSAAFIDWTNDWVTLQNRYAVAQKAAQSFVTASKFNPLPASAIPAQAAYSGLLKAMRQCAPPDGCPVVKGDWADLFGRLTTAAGTLGMAGPVDNAAQPTATDWDQRVFAASAPVDVVAQVTGQQLAGPIPPGGALTTLTWLANHKKVLLLGAGALVGGLLLLELAPVLILPFKGAKALAALAA